jgi:hypothetical protein
MDLTAIGLSFVSPHTVFCCCFGVLACWHICTDWLRVTLACIVDHPDYDVILDQQDS